MNALVGESPVLLVTLDDAAQRLSVCKRTLEREIAAGRFPRPIKIGRATRVSVAEIDAYVARLSKSVQS